MYGLVEEEEEEEEVSVSKISRREKGYRSFVRL